MSASTSSSSSGSNPPHESVFEAIGAHALISNSSATASGDHSQTFAALLSAADQLGISWDEISDELKKSEAERAPAPEGPPLELTIPAGYGLKANRPFEGYQEYLVARNPAEGIMDEDPDRIVSMSVIQTQLEDESPLSGTTQFHELVLLAYLRTRAPIAVTRRGVTKMVASDYDVIDDFKDDCKACAHTLMARLQRWWEKNRDTIPTSGWDDDVLDAEERKFCAGDALLQHIVSTLKQNMRDAPPSMYERAREMMWSGQRELSGANLRHMWEDMGCNADDFCRNVRALVANTMAEAVLGSCVRYANQAATKYATQYADFQYWSSISATNNRGRFLRLWCELSVRMRVSAGDSQSLRNMYSSMAQTWKRGFLCAHVIAQHKEVVETVRVESRTVRWGRNTDRIVSVVDVLEACICVDAVTVAKARGVDAAAVKTIVDGRRCSTETLQEVIKWDKKLRAHNLPMALMVLVMMMPDALVDSIAEPLDYATMHGECLLMIQREKLKTGATETKDR